MEREGGQTERETVGAHVKRFAKILLTKGLPSIGPRCRQTTSLQIIKSLAVVGSFRRFVWFLGALCNGHDRAKRMTACSARTVHSSCSHHSNLSHTQNRKLSAKKATGEKAERKSESTRMCRFYHTVIQIIVMLTNVTDWACPFSCRRTRN